VPRPVDFVAVALGAERAVETLEQAAAVGARAALVIASGFAEAGDEGRILQARLRDTALRHGLAVCGPNCYGIANLHGRFAAYGGPLATPMEPGPVALIFQSGALTHSVTDPSVLRQTGYSFVVTTGNEAVTDVADYLGLIAEDEQTRVIACFVEGFRSVSKFAAAAEKARAAGKRVVVLKVGRSELGQRAALAHTGAVAGADAVYDALFDRLGVVRVSDLDELVETVELLSHVPTIASGHTAVVTISGGGAGMAADLAEDVGLPLGPLGAATTERLRAVLPSFAHPGNPLDVTGAVGENPDLLGEALRALADDDGVTAIALAVNSSTATDAVSRRLHRAMTESLCDLAPHCDKPLVLVSITAGAVDPELLDLAREAGIPFLAGMRGALLALARVRRLSKHAGAPERRDEAPPEGLRELTATWPADRPLSESESKRLLELVGLAVPRAALAVDAASAGRHAAALGFPVVLKVESADIPHKTDAGGVRTGVADEAAAVRAYEEIVASVRERVPGAAIDGVSVQEEVGEGVDVIVGITNDADAGPAVVFGLGGVFVEVLDDVVVRMAPVDEREAGEMIDAIRGRALLAGYRGGRAVDVDALRDAIVRISALGWWLRDSVREIDVNPLRVLPVDEGVRVLDALVVPAHAR
jgi:acetyltransferase